MERRWGKNTFSILIVIAVSVLAIFAYALTRYLEDKTKQSTEVSAFVSSSKEVPSISPTKSSGGGNPNQATPTPSPTSNILQLLIESVNNVGRVEENYKRFRQDQIDNISLEEFQLYVNLLHDLVGQNIETYLLMSHSEKQQTVNSILEHDPGHAEFLDKAVFYWLEYHQDDKVERLPIILSKNKNGETYLSRTWVRSCLELRNFASLYFSVLTDQNEDALYHLVYADSDDETVRLAKTQNLLEFYKDYVKAETVGPDRIVSVRMDQIQFRIPMEGANWDTNREVSLPPDKINGPTIASPTTTEETGESEDATGNENPSETPTTEPIPAKNQYHSVTIYKRDNDFIVVDSIPSDTWKVNAELEIGRDKTLKLGLAHNLEDWISYLGKPQAVYSFTMTNRTNQVKDFVRLQFMGYELVLSSTEAKENGSWILEEIKIYDSLMTLAGRYKPGQSLRSLYQEYLYMDTLDYQYTTFTGERVEFKLKKNRISEIVVRSLDFRTDQILGDISEEKAIKPDDWLKSIESQKTQATTEQTTSE